MPYRERWRERPDETRQPTSRYAMQGAKSGGKREMRIRPAHIESSVCGFLYHEKIAAKNERNEKIWRKDCLHLNV